MGNLYTSTTFMEHNSHPDYKYEMDAPTHEHDGINPSCGDELTLQLRVENGVIEEASFTGHGCAISQASADIMADLITGETVEEARRLAGLFLAMIRGEQLSEEDLEDLDEAIEAMLTGNAVFFIDGYDKAMKISSKGYPSMGVMKAESEKVLRGSQEDFQTV